MAMESSAEALGSGKSEDDDRYAAALDHWLACGAADLDDRIPATLAELGLDVGPEALMTALSGGQAARVALAALLLSRFDIVLLDEPTNDLDLAGLARLEEFVKGLRGGVVLVSHDREFLARTITSVVELDLAQNKVAVYDGGYDSFLEERAIAKRHAREAYDEFADKKADLVGRARTQREWSSQGVRNAMKKAPDNDKIRRRASSESSEKQAQKVRQMESRIARLDEVEEPRKEWALQFSIAAAPRSSTVVSTLNEAMVQQGDFTMGPVSLQVNAGERIGITGPNGAGKSTLLKLLLGRTSPDNGTASLGANVAIGEIDQARSQFPEGVPARRRLRGAGSRDEPGRGPHAAGKVWAQGRPGDEPRRRTLPRRTHPRLAWRCCRPAASTFWYSMSPPTTSICPPLSSSKRPWKATRARCCWSPTTAVCWKTCGWIPRGPFTMARLPSSRSTLHSPFQIEL